MSEFLGFVNAAAQLGLSAVLVRPKRNIGPFVAHVTLRESHDDEMEITEHPVEQGAAIADHAYKRPASVVIECGWSNSPQTAGVLDAVVNSVKGTVAGVQSIITGNAPNSIRDLYAKMLQLQVGKTPFDVSTGKRSYSNMLIRHITVVTDPKTENALLMTIQLRQVLIVSTQTLNVSAPASQQSSPESTAPPVNLGTKALVPATQFNDAGGGRGFVNPAVVQ